MDTHHFVKKNQLKRLINQSFKGSILKKQYRISNRILSLLYLIVALFTLSLLAVLTFKYQISVIIFPLQRRLTGLFFATICLIGIMVGVFPSRSSQILHFRRRNKIFSKNSQTNLQKRPVVYKGHHPICENFNAHVLQIGGKKYCAGCTGLIIGAVISLFGCFFIAVITGLRSPYSARVPVTMQTLFTIPNLLLKIQILTISHVTISSFLISIFAFLPTIFSRCF